jgi:hypothetical protein
VKDKPRRAVDVTAANQPCCVRCGCRKDIEQHHVGGRNHAPAFTLALCRPCHVAVTKALLSAGVDMRYTANKFERITRALRAILVFVWVLLEEDSDK